MNLHHSTISRSLRIFLITAFCVVSDCNLLLPGQTAAVMAEDQTAVTLTPGTWDDVEALVKNSNGKIVVVDIWSTSCLPCMTEFPNLVKLQNRFPSELVCISFNVDYVGIKSKPPEAYRERVEKFLKKQSATFDNVLCTTESDALFAHLKLTSIPAVYVYDQDGKLAKRFDDSLLTDGKEEAFTYEADINPLIDRLLKK